MTLRCPHSLVLVLAVFTICGEGTRKDGDDTEYQCRIDGPPGSEIYFIAATANCNSECSKLAYNTAEYEKRFADLFRPVYNEKSGECTCFIDDTDMLPPSTLPQARCTATHCWEDFKFAVGKFTHRTIFWQRNNKDDCLLCEDGDDCEKFEAGPGYGMGVLRKMDPEEVKHVLSALPFRVKKLPAEYQWVLPGYEADAAVESDQIISRLPCSKDCADDDGPGEVEGDFVCQRKDFGASSWEQAEASECEGLQQPPRPKCNTDPCDTFEWSIAKTAVCSEPCATKEKHGVLGYTCHKTVVLSGLQTVVSDEECAGVGEKPQPKPCNVHHCPNFQKTVCVSGYDGAIIADEKCDQAM